MQNFRKMEFTLPPYNQELESKLLKPQFNKNKFKWPPLQIATLSPRKHLQVAKARLCSLATNTPPPFPRPKVRKEKKEKSQLTSYILFICNSFSRITLIDDSGKTISARRLPEKSLPQYDALWCAVPNENNRKRRRDHCINGIAISANIDK